MNIATILEAIEKVENDLTDAEVPDTYPVVRGSNGDILVTAAHVYALAELLRKGEFEVEVISEG